MFGSDATPSHIVWKVLLCGLATCILGTNQNIAEANLLATFAITLHIFQKVCPPQ